MADENESLARILDGRSWEDFCDTLKAAGSVVLRESTPRDPFDRAEGWRYLSRLTRAALETFVEASDARAPRFQRTAGETIKMGMDNPDNVYLNAPVNGRYRYRIRGRRGTVHYLGFGTQAGNYGATGSLETTGYLEAKDMEIAPDGSFEVHVSTDPPPEGGANWLPMRPETRMVQVRQTRLDHAREELAQVTIERTDGPGRPRPLNPARMDRMLQGAAGFVLGCARLFQSWTEDFQKHVNELPRFPAEKALRAGGDPNIAYYHGYWELPRDQALVVDLRPPECDFWNFQLSNHWLESLDYTVFRVHLNPHTAVVAPDGAVRIVVAHEDPGCPNWLDPCGHLRGTMCVRWIRARSHPEPRVRRLLLEELPRA